MLRLREIRKSRKVTMKQLGEMVGLTESAIGLYETGRRKPDYEMLLKLGEALGCSVLDILGESDPEDEFMEDRLLLSGREDLRRLLHVAAERTPGQVERIIALLESMI